MGNYLLDKIKMKLSDKITIVVPCKNEENYIHHLLQSLKEQNIGNTQIIIADASTDNTRKVIAQHQGSLNVKIIDGGTVSVAKNNGAKLVKTPYILFIDSDVRFFSPTVIADSVDELESNNLDLVGIYIKCYDNSILARIGFGAFNVINGIMQHWIPFAIGAFFLTRRDKFEELGRFPAKYQTSEDFFLSKMYDVKKFKLVDHYFGQDSRRFQKMGYFGMAWYLIRNFWNRNNEKYWKSMDYSKYWE
jgi:glycosyltransferase involved in cell wall biosynthesis